MSNTNNTTDKISSKNFDKNFVFMVLGQIVSVLGSAVLRFALNLYVLDITGRADIFATVLAISFIPYIFFSPIGGAIADRFNRRNLMVIFDFASSAVVLLLILVLIKGDTSVTFIAVILTLLSLVSAMYQPAVQASIPVLVKEEGLEQANGIVSGVGALSAMIGPVLGGLLYGVIGISNLLIISCIAFALSAVMEIFIRIPFTKPDQDAPIIPTIISDLKAGFRYMVKENPTITKTVILAAAINLFLTAFIIVGAPYVLRVTMQSSDMMYSIGMAMAEAAMIIGALTIGLFSKRMSLETLYKWLIIIALLLLPMAFALTSGFLSLGYWPSFILFILCGVLIMALATIISIYVITQVQKETPNELLGKIMAIIMAVSQCAMPLGQLIYGLLIENFSTKMFVPVLFSAVTTFATALVAKKMLSKKSKA